MINYRIPTIDEFVTGFVYEIYSEGYFEDDLEYLSGWYRYTFGKTCWRSLEEIQEQLTLGNIRVLLNKSNQSLK